jgi:hypothetical protein
LSGVALLTVQHESGRSGRRLARTKDLPSPAHTEVTAQNEATLEAQEQMLSHRLDRLDPLSV